MSTMPILLRPQSAARSCTRQQRIGALLDALHPGGGVRGTCMDEVRLIRAGGPLALQGLALPCLLIACQPVPHYRVLTLAQEQAAPAQPLLAVAVSIDLKLAAELLLAMGTPHHQPAMPPAEPSPLDAAMSDAVLRLLQVLGSPLDARILGPAIVRELVYRTLAGPQGGAIHAALSGRHQLARIGKALRRIHADYGRQVDVASLAREAGMSVATFHSHFKAVTRTTPIQYLKATRLHQARLLMLQGGINAARASMLVGYESSSQFSREFKRLFGRTPTEESSALRKALSLGAGPFDYHENRNSDVP